MPDNGTIDLDREVTLPTPTLRRLARLHSRVEGAQLAAQALSQTLQQMQTLLREALTEACEEQGVSIPEGGSAPVDIDWRTGVVRIGAPEPPTPQGTMPLPAGPTAPAF